MGDKTLWDEFKQQCVEDIQIIILMEGIDGLLNEFEVWLLNNNYVDFINVKKIRDSSSKLNGSNSDRCF